MPLLAGFGSSLYWDIGLAVGFRWSMSLQRPYMLLDRLLEGDSVMGHHSLPAVRSWGLVGVGGDTSWSPNWKVYLLPVSSLLSLLPDHHNMSSFSLLGHLHRSL